jgi:regulator of RNase E activity RraA
MRIHEIPVSQRDSTYFVNAGTIRVEFYNRPVVVGGVLVFPGGVIVADLDDVAVVSRAKAKQVAAFARDIRQSDNRGAPAPIREGGLAFRLHTQRSVSMTCRGP